MEILIIRRGKRTTQQRENSIKSEQKVCFRRANAALNQTPDHFI